MSADQHKQIGIWRGARSKTFPLRMHQHSPCAQLTPLLDDWPLAPFLDDWPTLYNYLTLLPGLLAVHSTHSVLDMMPVNICVL
jgi:hypothetical protein